MRKFIFFLLVAHGSWLAAFSQYWQQQVNYTIDVSLNDKEHTLDGFEKIEYINNSPDTIKFIWFHLWPNAYKNDRTAFSDQLLENGNTKFYFSDKEQKGYINRLDFKVNNVTAQTEDHPQHIDIVKIILPAPLPPGQKAIITTPFHVKLPHNFSRGGHDGESYQVTQWYPKPAVYDKNGWHPMPYLDQGEFYSEFGSFDVRITLPENYIVAATGELQGDENKFFKEIIYKELKLIPENSQAAGKSINIKKDTFPTSSVKTKTLNYKQNNIHDFAWFADKRFYSDHDTVKLASGRIIDVYTYYLTKYTRGEYKINPSVEFAKKAIRFYSNQIGEYPYGVVSVVEGPQSFGGGMEYPTITVISPEESAKDLDHTIAHEIGHNWFYGILASNERNHPWMDEGFNTYYDNKYYASKYGSKEQLERILFETKAINKTDQPITTSSEKFSAVNYELEAYYKTGEWLRYLESELGTEAFNKAMQEYYRRWQFKHPQPEDFKKAIEESSGKDLDSIFSYLDKKGILPNQQRKGSKTVFVLPFKGPRSYLMSPSKDLFLLGPAIGVNSYDKLMLGAFVTNIKLPPSPFQFFLAPMYSTGSKGFTGIGLLNYTFYPDNIFRKIELGLNGAIFTVNEYKDDFGKNNFEGIQKIVPGFKLTLKEKDQRSPLHKYIQFKSFLIKEEAFDFYSDTLISGSDTTIGTRVNIIKENRTLNQLQFVIENNWALYPYRGELKIEQGKDFVRTAFTGKYFFNYVKEGGLDVRLFAGKFFYSSSKTFSKQFATDRYHLNMTGANGYEDYTYSDYFIGRNKFEGAASQQIMVRDGGFKVRTDLLAEKVGKTDDWLIAANFSTTIPSAINPLSILPIKIPLKIFMDIGTNAEAWKPNAGVDRFLFDAGLHIPLFKETINIYVPLIYSGVYKDYILSTIAKKNRLLKKISFSIDISHFSLRKFNRNLDF